MSASDSVSSSAEPLRDRMPEYLRLFAFGVMGSAGFAAVVALLSSAGFSTALGNTLIVLGVGMLFVGGLGGGGYAHLSSGAIDSVLKKTSRHYGRRDDAPAAEGPGTRSAPPPQPPPPPPPPPPPTTATGRKGRYEPNPKAFWRVVAGFAYMALGAVVILQLAS